MTAIRAAGSDGRNGHAEGGGYTYGGSQPDPGPDLDRAATARKAGKDGGRPGDAGRAALSARSREKYALFCSLREQEVSIEEASAAAGVVVKTGKAYERKREAELRGERG